MSCVHYLGREREEQSYIYGVELPNFEIKSLFIHLVGTLYKCSNTCGNTHISSLVGFVDFF
jgi:hypothetical protein